MKVKVQADVICAAKNSEMGIYTDYRKDVVRKKGGLCTVHAIIPNMFEEHAIEGTCSVLN